MQQQTAQTQAEQTQQAKHETAAAVSDYSVSQAGENNNLIMLLMAAIICITVMLTSLTVTMQAAVDASGGQGDNNGTVCTQIVEAAQNELNDADKTVGGYRYKNWYGMDANWCAMFVSYCADKCGFIERVSCQRLQVSQLQSNGILTIICIMMQQADMCQRQVTLLFSETE